MKKTAPKFLNYLMPTFGNMIWCVVFILVLLLGRGMMNGDGDLGRHITIGNYILDNWKIPLQDQFSYTMLGQTLTPHEWLAQVLFALAERIAGFNGVVLMCALVIATTFWLVYKRVRLSSKNIFLALLAVFLAMVSTRLHWLTRPHIFTFLLLALWILILEKLWLGKSNRWWLLPILMLVWANLHGAFIAGFVTWFIFGVGVLWDFLRQKPSERTPLPHHYWRNFLLGGATSFLVSFINPSGADLWKTSVGYVGTKYLVNITNEYQSPNFHLTSTWPFALFILLLIVVLAYSKKKINSAHLFTSAAWAVMGLYSARNIPLFAITAAPLLTAGLDDLLMMVSARSKLALRFIDMDERLQTNDRRFKGWVWPALCIIIAIVGFAAGINFDGERVGYGFRPDVFPVEAVDWLEQNPQEGHVFNYFIWGGYLLYRDWPDTLVFIDGQTDFYGEALTRQYMQVLLVEEGWESVLEEYDVAWAILPVDQVSAQMIPLKLGWQVVYEDETAIILHR